MSKAIRILPNIPNDCGSCDIRVWTHDLGHICPSMGLVNDYIDKCRPEWCPLRPMPEREYEWDDDFYDDFRDADDYARGWNDCLDAILRGGENE